MIEKPCKLCHGKRLKEEVLAVTIAGRNIIEITEMSIAEAYQFFECDFDSKARENCQGNFKEIRERLQFMINVGLDYLSLARETKTLSGGEAQRIRLATQIGSGLTGVLYVLDEPSIGLHQKDNDKLLATLSHLRNLGNTLIVVEHDEDTMMQAEEIIDIGPGAGVYGGEIVAHGTPEEVMKNKESLTGQYLSGKRKLPFRKREEHGKTACY